MNIGPLNSSYASGMLSGMSISLDPRAVDGFAKEITRRSSQTATKDGAARTVDDKGLETAITGAVNYVKDTYGDKAANTVMGIVLNKAGSGPLTEDDVGEGFTNALEFIDRNFGTSAGDQTIAVFNGQLNQAINGYFQNGKNESFMVKDQQAALEELSSAKGKAVASVAQTVQQNSAGSDASLLDLAGGGLQDFAKDGGSGQEPPVNEDGSPRTPDGASSGGNSGDVASTVGRFRRRGLARGRSGVSGGYEQSGLTPGLVLSRSA